MRLAASVPLVCAAILSSPFSAGAQGAGTVGTRAQGMAGAFVAVADDASAVHWNPGGLARGAYFSLLLDGTTADAIPDDGSALGGQRAGSLLALSMPALGLSYSRQSAATVVPTGLNGDFRLSSLVTHHAGATLVQSLTDAIAVGATVKLVRGRAGSDVIPAGSAEDALENWDVIGRTGTRVDVDLGVMATGSLGRLGLVVRNVSEPSFETPAGDELNLDRQVRGGASIFLLQNWILAADLDFTSSPQAFGDVRELAFGTEAQVHRRLAARGGVKVNTAGDRGRSPALSVGGSFALLGSLLIDAQVTSGADTAFRGWGVAGRMVF
jgi:hypothetical protein